MTAAARATASHAISAALREVLETEPQMAPGDVAYLLVREGALHLCDHRGGSKTADTLQALADELGGGR